MFCTGFRSILLFCTFFLLLICIYCDCFLQADTETVEETQTVRNNPHTPPSLPPSLPSFLLMLNKSAFSFSATFVFGSSRWVSPHDTLCWNFEFNHSCLPSVFLCSEFDFIDIDLSGEIDMEEFFEFVREVRFIFFSSPFQN
jgi:hypothetical protein